MIFIFSVIYLLKNSHFPFIRLISPYLCIIKFCSFIYHRNEKTESEIEIISDAEENKESERMRAKFLKFHENYRPAYYGTWRKKCSMVKPRNPFKKAEVSNHSKIITAIM